MELWSKEWGIGIDPGWVSMGCATVKATEESFKFDVVYAQTWDPSQQLTGNVISFAACAMMRPIPTEVLQGEQLVPLCIERYVSYGNVRSTHTEEILMVVGRLQQEFFSRRGVSEPMMLKAIDWKTKLCQTLVQYTGFDNPSKKGSLDKEFSVAAAKHLTINHDLIVDSHTADSVCLAAYPLVLAQARAAKIGT